MAVRFHHVANGSSTTDTIARAGLAGARSIWADPLHDGPVPGDLDDRALLDARARYFAESFAWSRDELTAELLRWRAAIDDVEAWDELVLWFEHDLFDQLNLIQLLDRLRGSPASSRPMTLVCIGSFPGRPDFRGLGELTPTELVSLFPSRRPVTAAQLALAQKAWTAFRSPDPRSIERLLASDTEGLPFLRAALERLLEELPWTTDGLSRTERRILELASDTPIDIRGAFHQVSRGETAFYVADVSFWGLVLGLRDAAPALIEARTAPAAQERVNDAALPRGTLALTDAGRAVLDGATDRIARCGIDRWLGGTRLEGNGPTWRFDPGARRVVFV